MITFPLIARGAPVIVYRLLGSVVCASQTLLPDAASRAISLPSSVPTNTLPFYAATPRFTTSQQALTAQPGFTFGSNEQSFSPYPTLCAKPLLKAVVKYMTPSMT